jgi:hypothetical protein
MKAFIHVCKNGEELFNSWIEHTKNLGLPDLIVWAEPDVNINYKVDKRYKSDYIPQNILTSDIFLKAISPINEPVLYLESDAWPLVKDWSLILEEEYYKLNSPGAMISSDSYPPFDLVGGIGIYNWNKLPHITLDEMHSSIPDWASFDMWFYNLSNDIVKKTQLIRHSYGVYNDDKLVGFHKIDTKEKFDELTRGGVIFHKDKYGLIKNWIK